MKRSCGHCRYLQIDYGMYNGMWCDKGRDWRNTDADSCSEYESGMIGKQFPTWTKHMCIIYVDTGKKHTRKEIIEQMINQETIISDEDAFLRHLIRRYKE